MRKKSPLIAAILLMSIISLAGTNRVCAQGTKVSVQPSPIDWAYPYHTINETLTINITALNVVDLWAWQAGLRWDPTILECTNVEWGEFLTLSGGGLHHEGVIDNSTGQIYPPYGETSGVDYVNATKIRLLTVTFRTKAYGTTSLTLINVKFVLKDPVTGFPSVSYYPSLQHSTFTFVLAQVIDHTIIWNQTTFHVVTVSNSTVSQEITLNTEARTLNFTLTGSDGTTGFCNITIPKTLMWCNTLAEWNITVDNSPPTSLERKEDTDNTYLYFTYSHSIRNVKITSTYSVPEFTAELTILLFIIATLAAVIIRKKKLLTKRRQLGFSKLAGLRGT